jgi:ATP synthase protein I
MTDREPDDLDQLGAKLKAARERTGTDGTKELASEGSSFGYGLRLSVELLAGLLVGLGIGYAIDGWLGTRPWLMLVFMILGLAAGILNVMRVSRQMDQRAEYDKDQR